VKRTNGILLAAALVILIGALAFMQAGSDPLSSGADDEAAQANLPQNASKGAPTVDDLEKQVGAGGNGPMQKAAVAPGDRFVEKRDPTQPSGFWWQGGRQAKSGKELATGGKTK